MWNTQRGVQKTDLQVKHSPTTTVVHHEVRTKGALPLQWHLPTLLIISCKFRSGVLRLGSIKASPYSEQVICRPTRHQPQLILSARDGKLAGGTSTPMFMSRDWGGKHSGRRLYRGLNREKLAITGTEKQYVTRVSEYLPCIREPIKTHLHDLESLGPRDRYACRCENIGNTILPHCIWFYDFCLQDRTQRETWQSVAKCATMPDVSQQCPGICTAQQQSSGGWGREGNRAGPWNCFTFHLLWIITAVANPRSKERVPKLIAGHARKSTSPRNTAFTGFACS